MANIQTKNLCMELIRADSEDVVVSILESAGYWTDAQAWRFYDDHENNYSQVGNQQGRADAALVEKLVNSVDARLINECLVREIDPEGEEAPQSIRDAVAQFFHGSKPDKKTSSGKMADWTPSGRTAAARKITLAATGFLPKDGKPCITISDCGEGQTPSRMPQTFLSLTQSNKLRIPFVQGRFNMGGTGVLTFCGKRNLQLVLSRRNPELCRNGTQAANDSHWGFTIVRRESPKKGDKRRNSVFTYLSPVGCDARPNKGEVLSFKADELPIFPEKNQPYSRPSKWGTLIKLYEYDLTGSKSHILRRSGILQRLDLLMPEVALPVRLHECRAYGGKEGSYDTTLTGVKFRLEDNKGENLEKGFPDSARLRVSGEDLIATIYAIKKDAVDTYKQKEGVVFSLHGQVNARLSNNFFKKSKVGLSYIADSILVHLDCSRISIVTRENLFMTSRDRLRDGELKHEIEDSLATLLKNHVGLRTLKEKRRREELGERLGDQKPLEEMLKSILKDSPVLYKLFLPGARLTNPFKTTSVKESETKIFEGKRFPTFFNFQGKPYGYVLKRDCHVNKACRILFETDAENKYFDRQIDPAECSVYIIDGEQRKFLDSYVLSLHNGSATLSFSLPEWIGIGERVEFAISITDISRLDPIVNEFTLRVLPKADEKETKTKRKRNPPGKEVGEDREIPTGIELPNMRPVYEEKREDERTWSEMNPPFNKYSALRVVNAGLGQEENGDGVMNCYDFYINMDNLFLRTELKGLKGEVEVINARYQYGMILIGLGLLQENIQRRKNIGASENCYDREDSEVENIEDRIESVTRALSPILLPMIESLGGLSLQDVD